MSDRQSGTTTSIADQRLTTATGASVQHALAALERGERDALESVQAALCAHVNALRVAGFSRNDVLEEVRKLVTTPATDAGSRAMPVLAREALADLSLRWCAEEYDSPREN